MRLAGIPIQIRPLFFVTALFFGVTGRSTPGGLAIWVGLVLISVLIHELGHAFMARSFGLSPSIQLHAWGGLTSFEGGQSLSTGRDILISLAGPAAGFLAGGVVYFIGQATEVASANPWWRLAYSDALWINLGWGILNLLPILPLDGGHILESGLRKRDPAGRLAPIISAVVSAGAAAVAIVYRAYGAAFVAIWLAVENGRSVQMQRQDRSDEPLWPLFERARRQFEEGSIIQARAALLEIAERAASSAMRAQAVHLLAHLYLGEEDYEAALKILARCPPEFPPDPGVMAFLMLQTGLPERALVAAEQSFGQAPSPDSARLLLRAMVEAGRIGEATAFSQEGGSDYLTDTELRYLQHEAFVADEMSYSVEAGTRAFRADGRPDTAYNVACAWARLGKVRDAAKWLHEAIDAGFDDIEGLMADTDLAALRGSSEFQAIRDRIR